MCSESLGGASPISTFIAIVGFSIDIKIAIMIVNLDNDSEKPD